MKSPMEDNYKIRKANPDDWDEISRISAEVSEEGLISDYISGIGKKYLTIGETFLIETGGKVVGYHNVQDVPDGSIYLSGLRISKPHRKKGLAIWLIRQTISSCIAMGKSVARAYIEPENLASRGLFEKAGFIKSRLVHLYFGSIDTGEFSPVEEWPDSIVDIGHLPSRYFQQIPAKILKKEGCVICRSEPGVWDGLPSFTVLNPNGCRFVEGSSFIVSMEAIDVAEHGKLRIVEGFRSAYLYEKDLSLS